MRLAQQDYTVFLSNFQTFFVSVHCFWLRKFNQFTWSSAESIARFIGGRMYMVMFVSILLACDITGILTFVWSVSGFRCILRYLFRIALNLFKESNLKQDGHDSGC